MAKYCYCCGKKVKWLDSDLTNGKICDDCFEIAKSKDKNITRFNISNYHGEYIKTLVNNGHTYYGEKMGQSKYQKAAEKGEKVSAVALRVFIGAVILLVIIGLSNETDEFIHNLKTGNFNETETTTVEKKFEEKNLSPDEYISKFKNGKPKNSSETVDALFRRNYGTPRYKYEEENGEKYVLVRADSTSRCETVTFYFRITGNEFVPVKCILRDQVQFKDNYLGEESARLILNTIFKNN